MENNIPKATLLIASLIQSGLLTLLYRSTKYHSWPDSDPTWFMAAVTFVISLPLLLALVATKANFNRALLYLSGFSALLSALGAYVGSQQKPVALINNELFLSSFIISALILTFIALLYLKPIINKQAFHYRKMFERAWLHFVVFFEAWLFVVALWAILFLAADLFSILGIKIFAGLMQQHWFVIPLFTLATGAAITIFRSVFSASKHISLILQTLIKFLLPILTLISLGFLSVLPFTGLSPLWQTGSGSLLLLWLQALTLFFVNGAYQHQGVKSPYPIKLNRLILTCVALLPIHSAIIAYGLFLRIDQYGLTVERCWAVLIWLLLASCSIGYVIGLFRKQQMWLHTLEQVNKILGGATAVLLCLIHTPLLNFQSLSADSQLQRFKQNQYKLEHFDEYYFSNYLGRQGYDKIQALKQQLNSPSADLVTAIDRMYRDRSNFIEQAVELDSFIENAVFWPQQQSFPEELIELIYQQESHNIRAYNNHSYYFIAIDLNQDKEADFITIKESSISTRATLWRYCSGQWQAIAMTTSNPKDIQFLKPLLQQTPPRTAEPKWQDLYIGNVRFQIEPN